MSIKLLTLNLKINNICNYRKTTKEQTLFCSPKRLLERFPGNHADMILMQSCPGGSVIDDAKVQGHPAKKSMNPTITLDFKSFKKPFDLALASDETLSLVSNNFK